MAAAAPAAATSAQSQGIELGSAPHPLGVPDSQDQERTKDAQKLAINKAVSIAAHAELKQHEAQQAKLPANPAAAASAAHAAQLEATQQNNSNANKKKKVPLLDHLFDSSTDNLTPAQLAKLATNDINKATGGGGRGAKSVKVAASPFVGSGSPSVGSRRKETPALKYTVPGSEGPEEYARQKKRRESIMQARDRRTIVAGGGAGDSYADAFAPLSSQNQAIEPERSTIRTGPLGSASNAGGGGGGGGDDDDHDGGTPSRGKKEMKRSMSFWNKTFNSKEDKPKLTTIKSREGYWSQRIYWTMKSRQYMIINVTLTLFSLLAFDFSRAALPKAADEPISVMLFMLLIAFLVEICVYCFILRGYFNSFFFWLDVVGALSLIFDVSFIMDGLTGADGGLDTTQTGANGRVSRSASALRITKFARILRVVRLIRVVRIFKFQGRHRKTAAQPSKVGLHLAELIDKRVIIMLMSLLIILPLLTAVEDDDNLSGTMGLQMIDDATSVVARDRVASRYMQSHSSTLIYFLSSSLNTPNLYVDKGSSSLRAEEIEILRTPTAIAKFSLRDRVFTEALYNLLITLLIILMFGLGSFFISKDVHFLVVAPIERMTHIIRKLTGTICFLAAESEQEQNEMREGYEINVIENIINKMATIFNVEPDHTQGKAIALMTGSKHTEIKTNSSVVTVEVVERPRLPSIDYTAMDLSDGSAPIPVDVHRHPELSSIENVISNVTVAMYFKLFLTSRLLIENLLFYQEVSRFKQVWLTHSTRIFNTFCSSHAVTQINIPATVRDAIRDKLPMPTFNMFDKAQASVVELMRDNGYHPFLGSKYVQMYLQNKLQRMQGDAAKAVKNFKSSQERRRHRESLHSHSGRASGRFTSNQLAHLAANGIDPVAEEDSKHDHGGGGGGGGGGADGGGGGSATGMDSSPAIGSPQSGDVSDTGSHRVNVNPARKSGMWANVPSPSESAERAMRAPLDEVI